MPPAPESGDITLRFERAPKQGFTSVIIPVFRDADGLTDTLISLGRQTLPSAEYEIVVANDGASPGISRVCSEFGVLEVRITPNAGAYYARNRAMEQASGEYFALVDADIEVRESWLELGRTRLQTADYVGGPAIIPESSATTPARHHDMLTGFEALTADNEHRFFGGGNMFVKREVVEAIGGFDPRLRSGGDNEFGNRLFRTGKYRRAFVEDLAVLHPARDYPELVKKRIRLHRGRRMLRALYPDRYRYRSRSLVRTLRDVLLPPNPLSARRTYPSNPNFGFLRYYFFRWRYKAEVALRLVPVYHERLDTASPVEARVKVHDWRSVPR
jgi:glycosyltransferase AglI